MMCTVQEDADDFIFPEMSMMTTMMILTIDTTVMTLPTTLMRMCFMS